MMEVVSVNDDMLMIDVHKYVAERAVEGAWDGAAEETLEKLDRLMAYIDYLDHCVKNNPFPDRVVTAVALIDGVGRELAAVIGGDYDAITSLPDSPISAAAIDGIPDEGRLVALAVRKSLCFVYACCALLALEMPHPPDVSLGDKLKVRRVEALKAMNYAISLCEYTAVRVMLSTAYDYIRSATYLLLVGVSEARVAYAVSLIVSTCQALAEEIGSDYVTELKMSDRAARARARREDWAAHRFVVSKAIRELFTFTVALCTLHGFPPPQIEDGEHED